MRRRYTDWTKEKLDKELEKMHEWAKTAHPDRPRYQVRYWGLVEILEKSGWQSDDFWQYVTGGLCS